MKKRRSINNLLLDLQGNDPTLQCEAAKTLSDSLTERTLAKLVSTLASNKSPGFRYWAAYSLAFSFTPEPLGPAIIGILFEIAGDAAESATVRAQAIEGL